MRLEVEVTTSASRSQVWDVLTQWERQPEWMLDAKEVRVLTAHREGEGVTIICPTLLMGVTVDDVMRVTSWVDERELGVIHLGSVITGTGTFLLDDTSDGGCRVTWVEEVDPPLGGLGEWGASTFVLPVLRRIFTRSLRRLVDLAASG